MRPPSGDQTGRGAVGQLGGRSVTAEQPQLARQMRARLGRGRVDGERDRLAIGRDGDLGRRPEREQALRHVAEGHVVLVDDRGSLGGRAGWRPRQDSNLRPSA